MGATTKSNQIYRAVKNDVKQQYNNRIIKPERAGKELAERVFKNSLKRSCIGNCSENEGEKRSGKKFKILLIKMKGEKFAYILKLNNFTPIPLFNVFFI